jgi:hypothetical protein
MRLSLFFVVIMAVVAGSYSLAYGGELRQCANDSCGKYALSESWLFCPFCGTELPEVDKSSDNTPIKESVIGYTYKNGVYNFQIERPNDKWAFLRAGRGLEEISTDGTIGITSSDEVYALIIVERVPDADLSAYAELVAPDLIDRIRTSEEAISIAGAAGLRSKWVGSVSGIEFRFYQTVIKHRGLMYQIVFWCIAGNENKTVEAEIEAIEASFKFLSD